MRTKLILAAILVQFLVLGWMAGEREWIVRTGPVVWLRTAPVDPRDLFRGDYVRLNYEISSIPADRFGPGLKKRMADLVTNNAGGRSWHSREIVIYTALKVDPATGVAEMVTADLTPPTSGLFIKGRVRPYWNTDQTPLTGVAYGIDSYFVQQGKGWDLQRRTPEGMPQEIQVPMEMRIALGSNGTAVLTNHRWNPLGIGMTIQRQVPPGTATDPATGHKPGHKIIRVILGNASATPQAVVLPPDLRTLHLQHLQTTNGPGVDATIPRKDPQSLTDSDVRVLNPGETVTVEIDPARAEWFVKPQAGGPPVPLGRKDDMYQTFRVVYAPPAADACLGLKEAACIAPGQLASRQFSSYELREE